jgi:phage regulator Rha-like protein
MMNSKITVSEIPGSVLIVDSRLIAERLGIEHINFMETIGDYQTQIDQAFGVVRFETEKPPRGSRGGRPQRYALLTEDQATFLMTLSRNTPEVVQCKIDLVVAFSKAKDLLANRKPDPKRIPYWYKRIQIAMSDSDLPLQAGYFCIYQEIMGFFAELETRFGYVIPDIDEKTGKHLVPDISIAQGFNKFLRNEDEMPSYARNRFLGNSEAVDFREGASHFCEIEKYNHVYPKISHGDYNVQPANSYPNKYLELFRYYLQEYWIPDDCTRYLVKRDSPGVSAIQGQVTAMLPGERNALSTTLVGKLISSLFSLPPQK